MDKTALDCSYTEYTVKSILTNDVINSIGHDLKTPLTSIKGFNQLMQSNCDLNESQTKHYNELIDKNSDRLFAAIINLIDILEYNKTHIEEVEKKCQKEQ